jgi:hypothetical protein
MIAAAAVLDEPSTGCHSAIELCRAACASSIAVEESTSGTIHAPGCVCPFTCTDADETGVGDGPCGLAFYTPLALPA